MDDDDYVRVDEDGWVHSGSDTEADLRAEVADWHSFADVLALEVAALKAELAKYTEPLTDEQAQAVWDALPVDYFGEDEMTLARQCDAFIRKVRADG